MQEFKTNNLYVYSGITGLPVTELKGDPSDYNGRSMVIQTRRNASKSNSPTISKRSFSGIQETTISLKSI